MRPSQSEDGETREFLVIPPVGEWFYTNSLTMLQELERRFPSMKFTISAEPGQQDDSGFKLIPILGATDSNLPMLQWPSMDVIDDVLSCLAEFIVQSEKPQLLN